MLPYLWLGLGMCLLSLMMLLLCVRLGNPTQPPSDETLFSLSMSLSLLLPLSVSVSICVLLVIIIAIAGEPAESRDLRHTSRIYYPSATPTVLNPIIIGTARPPSSSSAARVPLRLAHYHLRRQIQQVRSLDIAPSLMDPIHFHFSRAWARAGSRGDNDPVFQPPFRACPISLSLRFLRQQHPVFSATYKPTKPNNTNTNTNALVLFSRCRAIQRPPERRRPPPALLLRSALPHRRMPPPNLLLLHVHIQPRAFLVGGIVVVAVALGLSLAAERLCVLHQKNVLRIHAVPAQRTRGMRVQPRVHALDVERVLAFRQQPENLRRLELRQAHRAVQPLLLSPQRSESENGKRFHHGPVNAGVLSPGERRHRPRNRAPAAVDVAAVAVFDVKKEQRGEGDYGGQNAYHHRYARSERRRGVIFVVGRRRSNDSLGSGRWSFSGVCCVCKE